ncbi:hypothetical protein GCM10010495_16840 [Kitasatospora herbaricolor]|nr:DNA-binding transcriptional MerR regulator [Kitasatospora herbaricolor]GGV05633.1 hypothetical protein GCM10010495_16840 [Kitasatospora herbaricolor]
MTTLTPATDAPAARHAVAVCPPARAAGPSPDPADTGRRSCAEAYAAPDSTPDRSPRHTISEVAAATGLTAHTLRWYERIGLLDPVDRTYSGQRRYSDGDLARLGFLSRLRLTGMSVADMLRYVELARLGEHTFAERRDLLVTHREEVRQRLADLHATLAVLDHKIDLYSGTQDPTALREPPTGPDPARARRPAARIRHTATEQHPVPERHLVTEQAPVTEQPPVTARAPRTRAPSKQRKQSA